MYWKNDYDQLIKKDSLVFLSYSIKTKLINFVFTRFFTRFPQRYTADMIVGCARIDATLVFHTVSHAFNKMVK